MKYYMSKEFHGMGRGYYTFEGHDTDGNDAWRFHVIVWGRNPSHAADRAFAYLMRRAPKGTMEDGSWGTFYPCDHEHAYSCPDHPDREDLNQEAQEDGEEEFQEDRDAFCPVCHCEGHGGFILFVEGGVGQGWNGPFPSEEDAKDSIPYYHTALTVPRILTGKNARRVRDWRDLPYPEPPEFDPKASRPL